MQLQCHLLLYCGMTTRRPNSSTGRMVGQTYYINIFWNLYLSFSAVHSNSLKIKFARYKGRRHQMERFSALLALCAGKSPHKGRWCRALMFSLIYAWRNSWANNRDACDLWRHRAHYDVISSVICMRAQVNSSTLANICLLIQTFKYQCCGFQVHFKSILVYNVKTKSDLCQMSTLHNGLHNKFGFYFFLCSLVLNLAYIDYSLRQIWSVNIQCLRCCDHSNKCLFLVIQEAEVLLNILWWV